MSVTHILLFTALHLTKAYVQAVFLFNNNDNKNFLLYLHIELLNEERRTGDTEGSWLFISK